MTIEKGQPWGVPGPLPAGGVVVRSDREASEAITAAKREQRPLPVLGLLGGDLARTLGAPGDEARLHSDAAMTFPIDLGSVLIDGRIHWFVAHLVARRGWWRGRIVAAMNAQYLGTWDVAPKSHPNDGKLDVLDSDLPFGQRLEARRRLPLGTHVPHPDIEQRRTSAIQFELDRLTPIYLDGTPVGPGRNLSIRVEPDALTVVI